MTQLERFYAALKHKSSEKPLFYAEFVPSVLQRFCGFMGMDYGAITEKYGIFDPVYAGLPREGAPPEAFAPFFRGEDMPDGAWINFLGVMEIPCDTWHFTRYVSPGRNMTSLEEIKTIPLPVCRETGVADMAEAVEKAHARGRAAVSWIGHMYEDAWQIRGYVPFLTDMLEKPEICEWLLDRILGENLKAGRAAARAGVDMLKIGDDVANQRSLMFGAELWRRFMKPRWEHFISEVKKINPKVRVWYHSDGNIWELIPELIEIGVDVLNPVQPECLDVEQVKKEFGRHLVLDGCIGTQSLMPFGTPEDIKREIRRLRSLFKDGGLILSPTHVLEPDVPPENIKAFAEGCSG
ncbi:MAG: hypothetical protein ILO36_04040 [Abditibacteriota bacterium]|nr:hypothetical protein [Abditibacteriota bacterium]